uniref:SET domain-containing protein n=1 Tax=Panagrolaimus superbus TaxID=310955 RepID=A0A914ZDL5_9BILA
MVIHASSDIQKGDEIWHSYISPLTDFMDRKETFNCWKFKCDCKLCEIEANDKNYLKRSEIAKQFNEFAEANKESPHIVIVKGESVLKEIRETYDEKNEFKIQLISVHMILSGIYFDIDNVIKSIEYLEAAISLMDNLIKYAFNIAQITVNLAHCYLLLGNYPKVKEMVQKAFKFSFCIDMDHFKMCFPEIANDLP